jgi:hypothetical protein
MNVHNSPPLTNGENTPLALAAQDFVPRSYTNSNQIIAIAIDKYKKYGKGLTYVDLQEAGLAESKKQAQNILKHHLKKETLFTLSDKRPQEYYPSCLRSEILKCYHVNFVYNDVTLQLFPTYKISNDRSNRTDILPTEDELDRHPLSHFIISCSSPFMY